MSGPSTFSSLLTADRQARCLLTVAAHLLDPPTQSPRIPSFGEVPPAPVTDAGAGVEPTTTPKMTVGQWNATGAEDYDPVTATYRDAPAETGDET